jgi:hypothetical protein
MYSVTVKIEEVERRRRSAGLLHIVLGFFLIAKGSDYYRYLDYESFLPVLPAFIMAGISLGYGFFRRQFDPLAKYNYTLRILQVVTFALLALAFMRFGKPIDYIGLLVFSFLAVLLMFSERRVFQETNLVFMDNGVQIPGTYKDHLVPWEALSDVIVREDFVTIFHIKKKYLQYQVMQDLSTLEVAKMNAFCKE